MKPFTIYHYLGYSFPGQEERLKSLILEAVKPDKVFLLGASLIRRRTESIFNDLAPTSQHLAHYFLLVLMNEENGGPAYEVQDKIEQHCNSFIPVTAIALKTTQFNEWLKCGHPFARTVYHASVSLYNGTGEPLPPPGHFDPEVEQKALSAYYTDGLRKAREFLAAAELFRVRKQNKMTAFMLHQAVEQALRTLLKVGTGFHTCTHNVERLIRYGSMVSYMLPDLFSKRTEREKYFLSLLQKAYIDARYKDGYTISSSDLLILTERAQKITEILETIGEKFFTPQVHNQSR